MAEKKLDQQEEGGTYLTLLGIFLSVFAIFAARTRKGYEIKPFDLALLALATYRAGRLTAYDKVTEPLRTPFTRTEKDDSGEEHVVAKGTGIQRALGELISCPTCVGTWIAAGLIYIRTLIPGPTNLLVSVLAATGAAELLDNLASALSQASKGGNESKGKS